MPHPDSTVVLPIRAAAILMWAIAFSFGMAALLTVTSVLRGRGLPLIMGFRAFGGGAFERLGMRAMVALLIAFLVVSVLESLVAWWLWKGEVRGGWFALGLLPVSAVFWWGFFLPIPPVMAVVRSLLILLNWRHFA